MKITGITSLDLPEIKLLTYQRFKDERGYFTETYRRPELDTYLTEHPESEFLNDLNFVQHNESFSKANTVRGFHFQWQPFQGKLVRCIQGRLLDFAIDIRPNSPTYGKITGADLKADHEQDQAQWIWIPPGFAHCAIFPEDTSIEYLCTGQWSPGNEAAISPLADDIDWTLCSPELMAMYKTIIENSPLVTDKDREGLNLARWRKDSRAEIFSKIS